VRVSVGISDVRGNDGREKRSERVGTGEGKGEGSRVVRNMVEV